MRNLRKKKIMIKLIASDIDGTLVKEGSHEISPEYFEVIKELKKVGIRFCACSGRQYASMLDLFRPVADDIFFISGNGTVVRTKERLLHSWHLEQDIILPIIEAIRRIEGASFVMETPGTCYTDAGDDSQLFLLMRDNYHYDIENVDDVTKLPFDKVTKFAIYHPTSIETSTEQIRKDPRFAHLSMTISGAWWLDITPREAGKGEAYALLQEYLGIKKEETVYFGDNLNDLSAFKETGIAATVANARQELKEAADLVERSYAKNGVLRELRNILGHARDYMAANSNE